MRVNRAKRAKATARLAAKANKTAFLMCVAKMPETRYSFSGT